MRHVREGHVTADERRRRGRRAAGSRRRPGACHRGVAVHDRHAHAAADHYHADGRRAPSPRGRRPALWADLQLAVRRGCSRVVQARWAALPLVATTAGSACGDLRPPESAESCDVMSTRRESE